MREQNIELNKGLIDAITPIEINFERNSMAIGEKLIKGYGVIKYPPEVRLGWLSDLTRMDNVLVSLLYYPQGSGELLEAVSKTIRQMAGTVQSTRDELQRQRAQTGVENGRELLERIDNLGESVGYFSICILAMGENNKELRQTCRTLEAKAAAMNIKLRTMANLQKEVYETVSPYHIPSDKILNCTRTIMPMSTYQYGMPASTVNFTDTSGYYFGKDMQNGLICLDMWTRNNDRTNSNWTIMGIPGQGKSYVVKHLITSEYMKGTKIYICDPEKEYCQLTKDLDGDIFSIGGSKTERINPMQIKTNGMREDDEHQLSDLAIHLKTLETHFDMYLPELSEMEQAVLKDSLIEVYKQKGITFDTNVSDMKNTDFPIMEDLYNYVSSIKNNKTAESLALLLKDSAIGGDSFLWNGATTIQSDSQIVCIDTSKLQEMPDKIKKTQYFDSLAWVWNQASKNPEENCLIVCDEAYLMIDENVPQALTYLKNIAKRGRKYSVGIMVISHSVVDFLAPAIKKDGQALLDLATYKIFFGCDGQNLKELSDLYNLKESEQEFLLSKHRGTGLVTIGSKRMKVRFALDYKKQYLTGGGK